MPPTSTLARVLSAPTADLLGPTANVLVETARTVAFWTAIALPFLYLPLLLTGGQNTGVVVTALVVVNVAALVVGHGHENGDASES
jgi:hypothetical protein